MRKHWYWAVGVLLAGGLLGLQLRGAPAPPAQPVPQPGRYVWSKMALVKLNANGEPVGGESQTLLDTGTGRVWVLADAGPDKHPRHKWVLASNPPE